MTPAAAIAARLEVAAASLPAAEPVHRCAICGRRLARRRSRSHRACYDASPEKSLLARAAATAPRAKAARRTGEPA